MLINQRKSQKEKEENNYSWYKENIDKLDKHNYDNSNFDYNNYNSAHSNYTIDSEYSRMKRNYNVYNNKISDLDYKELCELYNFNYTNEKIINRDIISSKIKSLLGIEIKRPFNYSFYAVNKEATTRKEQLKFDKIQSYVHSYIMQPIEQQIQKQYLEQMKGQKLDESQTEEMMKQMEQEIEASTPEDIHKYMTREHQDPAEVLANQLSSYLVEKEMLLHSFNKCLKHFIISSKAIGWIGEIGGHPKFKVVNPIRFKHSYTESDFIEDCEWATYEDLLDLSEVVSMFPDLTNEEIDSLHELIHSVDNNIMWDFNGNTYSNKIRVVHCTWKSLRKLGFLQKVNDETGEIDTILVNEYYKLNKASGDISLSFEWIPEVQEGYKIGNRIYKNMGPVKGQFTDINDIYKCKLPYKGIICDHDNSVPTAIMDRMIPYGMFYNVIADRLEKLVQSDKGKKLMVDISIIPKSKGVSLEKWFHYFNELNIGFFNPAEEGQRGEISTSTKEVDLSLMSQINNYIQLLDYLEKRCGDSVGITKAIEGQISPYEAVKNTQVNIAQSATILEPYFNLFTFFKKNVLESLIECAKYCYHDKPTFKLNFILDDFSKSLIEVDTELLTNSSYGIFVNNTTKAFENKQLITQLTHAAMQNQMADFSDIIKIMNTEDPQQASEILLVAEQRKQKQLEKMETQKQQFQATMQQKQLEHEELIHEREKELIILKENERRETEIQKQTIMSLGFNEDKDMNQNGKPDILEVSKVQNDMLIKIKKQNLDEEKFEHEKEIQKEKLKIDKKKIKE